METYHTNLTVQHIIELLKARIREENNIPILVAVTGLSGSGKSVLCRYLQQQLGCCSIVELDGFNYEKERRNKQGITGAHPAAFDKEKALQALLAVKHGKPVCLPREPIDTGITVPFTSNRIVLVDGQTSLFIPEWTSIYDYVILLNCPPSLLWERKKQQGDTKEIFELRLHQFEEHMKPYRHLIDFVIHG